MKALLSYLVGRVLVLVRSLGPYAAIELLLPGGSMLALLYWWHRHRVRKARASSKFDRHLDVRPFSESRVDVTRPIPCGQPRALPLSADRALAA